MAVDGFSFGLNDGAGAGVFDGGEKMGPERIEGAEGEEMLFVEIGGDDEEPLRMELVEGMVEEGGPELGAVPKILMAKEGEVSGAGDLFEEGEFGGVEIEKAGAQVGGALVLGRPAGGGLVELGGADIDAGELDLVEGMGKEVGEESGLVGTTAGEVEDVALGWELGTEVGNGMSF